MSFSIVFQYSDGTIILYRKITIPSHTRHTPIYLWYHKFNSLVMLVTFKGQNIESANGITEWEWKIGYKLSHSLEKLVSHEFQMRILLPICKGSGDGGFTWVSHGGKNLSLQINRRQLNFSTP